MADNSEAARARAEARLEKLQKTAQDSAAVWSQYEASRQAVRERTSTLRELRLAKQAEDNVAAALAAAEKASTKRKRKTVAKV